MAPNRIILHHSATKDSGTVSWNAIRRYHINDCNWMDIGYHFGIELIDDPLKPFNSYEILMGRMPNVQGGHTSGQNYRSIGICFVGNFDEAPPPVAQWEAGLKLVRWLMEEYRIPKNEVFGHRDFAHKTCPGTQFDIEKFKAEL